jgi:hypothetical protein
MKTPTRIKCLMWVALLVFLGLCGATQAQNQFVGPGLTEPLENPMVWSREGHTVHVWSDGTCWLREESSQRILDKERKSRIQQDYSSDNTIGGTVVLSEDARPFFSFLLRITSLDGAVVDWEDFQLSFWYDNPDQAWMFNKVAQNGDSGERMYDVVDESAPAAPGAEAPDKKGIRRATADHLGENKVTYGVGTAVAGVSYLGYKYYQAKKEDKLSDRKQALEKSGQKVPDARITVTANEVTAYSATNFQSVSCERGESGSGRCDLQFQRDECRDEDGDGLCD